MEETRRRGKILNDMWKNFDANPKQETTTNGETSSSNNDRSDQISRISNQERKDKRTEKKIRFQIPESDVTDLPKGASYCMGYFPLRRSRKGESSKQEHLFIHYLLCPIPLLKII